LNTRCQYIGYSTKECALQAEAAHPGCWSIQVAPPRPNDVSVIRARDVQPHNQGAVDRGKRTG